MGIKAQKQNVYRQMLHITVSTSMTLKWLINRVMHWFHSMPIKVAAILDCKRSRELVTNERTAGLRDRHVLTNSWLEIRQES